MRRDVCCGGFALPVLVIAAGVLLLLNTLDVVGWSVWRWVARLWPVLLIAGGALLLWQRTGSKED